MKRKKHLGINLLGILPANKKTSVDIVPWPKEANIVKVQVVKVFWINNGKIREAVSKGTFLFLRAAFEKISLYIVPGVNQRLSQRRILDLVSSGHIKVIASISKEELFESAGLKPSQMDAATDGWRVESGRLVYPAPKSQRISLDPVDDCPWVIINGRPVYFRET